MARRLVRGSKFKVGEEVIVDGDAAGDYRGVVVEKHLALTMPMRGTVLEEMRTQPGVTVRVKKWEGLELDYVMYVDAWDSETRAVV